MDSLAYARQRSAALREAIREQEQAILARLQGGVGLAAVASMEVALAALVAEAEDAATILQYYQNLGEIQRDGDIFKMVFQMDRRTGADEPTTSHAHAEDNNNSITTTSTTRGAAAAATTNSVTCTGVNSSAASDSDALLSSNATQWSSECLSRGLSGILIATSTVAFGVVEGTDEAAVRAVVSEVLQGPAARSLVPTSLTIVSTGRAHARQHAVGLKVHYVRDPTMDTILTKCREVVALGARFAPRHAAELAVRGGNPLVESIGAQRGVPLLLVAVAHHHGVVHSPAVYHDLALCVEGIAGPHGGRVLEVFGEHMIVAFDRRGKWPANAPLEVACHLLQQQATALAMPSSSPSAPAPAGSSSSSPSSLGAAAAKAPPIPMAPSDLLVVAHMGDVTYVNQPHCTAFGEGLRELKALAYVAEAAQRPLLITPVVLLHASKAMFRTIPFSHNTVGYHTFPGLSLTRQVHAPDVFRIEAPRGMKVVDAPKSPAPARGGAAASATTSNADAVRIVPATREDLLYGNAAAMPVTVEDSQVEEYKAYFSRLDAGGCGWTTKAALRSFLLSNEAFVVFPHDAPRIDGWIAEASSLGPERISLDEFLFLCVRMRQL